MSDDLDDEISESRWCRRRDLHIGASDVPALYVARYGAPDDVKIPEHVAYEARKHHKSDLRMPRVLQRKAGLLGPAKRTRPMDAGTRREAELIAAWRDRLETSPHPWEAIIDPASVTLASVVPRCTQPWVDRRCPALASTLDAWCRDELGAEIIVEAKCSVHPKDEEPGCPWHWRIQALAQIAVTDCDSAIVVCGQRWAAHWAPDGDIISWPVSRDDEEIAKIRDAAEWAAAEIEQVTKEVNSGG